MGRWQSIHVRGKNHQFYGKKHSEETREKLRISHIGIKQSKETIEKRKKWWTQERLETMKSKLKGRLVKDSTKEKIRNTTRSEIFRKNARERRKNQILPVKDTKPEIIIQDLLKSKNIEFIKHYSVKLSKGYHQCDIFIPSKNLIIECDGCYWHGCKKCLTEIQLNSLIPQKQSKKDIVINKQINNQGYKVLRFWEHEIKDNKFGGVLYSRI